MSTTARSTLAALSLALAYASPATAQDAPPKPTAEQVRFFESKVRPVLVENCYKCHGPDKQKGGLRVDSRSALLSGGESGEVVALGKPEESLLIAAIKHEEDGPKMPPSKKLDASHVAAISEWVKMGAPWPGETTAAPAVAAKKHAGMEITDKDRQHWAFQPVRRLEPPKVEDAKWVANPVDAFVLSKLEQAGFRPNAAASKTQLLRRLSYDLTGLPPTPAEVDAYVKDTSPDAYGKAVDRLLASPQYGVKWGRHWLDLVRYAETNSYERDNPKPSVWRYRDYVIRSFNEDKPYDRFIKEQIAGDELPDRTVDSVIATGFYRLGIWDDEPTDPLQARYDGLDDIVATTSQVFLGMTVDCARCHDHKIDPIPQKDYYKLVSFFQNINHFRNGGPTDEVPFVAPGSEAERAKEIREHDEKKAKLESEIQEIENVFKTKYESESGQTVNKPDLDELRFRFYRDTWDRLPDFAAIKYEDAGDVASKRFDISLRTRDEAFGFVFEGSLIVPADGEYVFDLDSDDGSRLTVNLKVLIEHDGLHTLGKPKTAKAVLKKGKSPIRLEYFQRTKALGLVVGWKGPGFERRLLTPAPKKEILADVGLMIHQHGERLLGFPTTDRYRKAKRELADLRKKGATSETILCVTEPGRNVPETHVLARGNPHVPGDRVEPGFLQVIDEKPAVIPTPPPDAKTSGRRTVLANWLASPSNPLTSRVIANRIFQHHFGRGIVRSPNNFGVQGDRPTHPELLDFLASELVANGWRLKPLHRLIVTSNAYKMSSLAQPEALAKDPINNLLWRFDMRRLSAEEIRDSILSVSGKLNLKMDGPGVYPPIPAEVMAGQSIPGYGWGRSSPEESSRRSVYIHVKRSLLTPILEGFDLAETDRSSPVRFSTTQPTQALGMLNGAFLQEQAGFLADRLRKEAGAKPDDQVRLALRLVTSREPSAREVDRGVRMIKALQSRQKLSEDVATKTFCLLTLNLNEFLYLD